MADRLQKGHSDGSDKNGGNGTLQGFELNRKIEGVEAGCVSAGHSRFNCTCRAKYMYVHKMYNVFNVQ